MEEMQDNFLVEEQAIITDCCVNTRLIYKLSPH